MVDPLEAKRLAAIQMREIQAKEKLKVNETFYHFKMLRVNNLSCLFGITSRCLANWQSFFST